MKKSVNSSPECPPVWFVDTMFARFFVTLKMAWPYAYCVQTGDVVDWLRITKLSTV